MSRFAVSIFLFHLLLANVLQGSTAVTVILDNGDSITGEALGETDENVTLKVDYLGEIILPKARIANWETVSGSLPQVGEAPAGTIAGTSAMPEEEYTDYDAPRVLDWISRLRAWDSRLQVGLTSHSGRQNRLDLHYRFDSSHSFDTHQFRLNAEYYYGTANEVKTSDRYATNFRWRRNISPGVFHESNSTYSADAIKFIESNIEQQFGLGTRFVETDAATLSAGLGASGRWRELSNQETPDVVYLFDLFQDWDYRLNERLRIRQDLRVAMPLEEEDDYEVRFSAALTSEITSSINLSLRYELGYDNSLLPDLKQDRRVISSLGYAF